MSVLANKMAMGLGPIDVYAAPPGARTTLNINCLNLGPAHDAVSLYMVPRADVGVSAVTVTNAGSGYVAIPGVSVSGGGGDGVALQVIMALETIRITDPGTGYQVADELTLAASGQGNDATAVVTVVGANGEIQAVTITTVGAYAQLPTSPTPVVGGTGSGATITGTFRVAQVNVVDSGGNFLSAPTVTFATGTATAIADIGAAPADRHKIEHNVVLEPGGVLYRTALIIGAGDRIYADAGTANVAISAWGVSALN